LPSNFITTIEEPYAGVAIARQYLLKRAIELMMSDESYTHALFLDSDVYINDPDGIKRLANWGADILGGSYLRIFPEGVYLASKFQFDGPNDVRLVKDVFYSISIPYITSGGCLLLSRKAVLDERLRFFPIWKFRTEINVYAENTSEDFGFCLLASSLGYKIFLDGTVSLTHYCGPKERSFRVDENGKYIDFKF